MVVSATGKKDELKVVLRGGFVEASGEQAAGQVVPERVLLLPWGWVESSNGRFLVDQESARLIVEAFERQETDLVVDYEHQSLGGKYASRSGLAPAAGWISRLEVVPGEGIFGRVRWTAAAMKRLARREYRYLSPVVVVRRSDRRVVAIDSAGLTNRPAIFGMRPVVNRKVTGDSSILENRKEGAMEQKVERLRKLLGLPDGASEPDVLDAACSRLEEMIVMANRRQAEDRVEDAMRQGKLTESLKEWAIRYAMRDPEGFEMWLKEAPVVVPMQRLVESAEGTVASEPRRESIIAAAKREWQANDLLQRLTSKRAYVNDALREGGLEPLGADERI